MDNGLPANTVTYRRVLEAVEAAGTQLLEPTQREIRLGAGAVLAVLPPPGVKGWDQNDNAIGAILTLGRFRLSLGGDAEQREWAWWVENYASLLGRVQVHKASHHGSNNGDAMAALGLLRPEVVVVSVGTNNGFGHPRPEVLEMYGEAGSAILRTDLNGTIRVEADASGTYSVAVERGDGLRLPALLPPLE
jgi:competence protein ComEC